MATTPTPPPFGPTGQQPLGATGQAPPPSGATTPPQKPMGTVWINLLALYLLVFTVLAAYGIYSLWSTDGICTECGSSSIPVPTCAAGAGPKLTHLYPDQVRVGLASDVLLIGCEFPAGTLVKVNGT